MALDRYVSVEVEAAPSLRVHSEGEGAGLFDDASHLAARVVTEVLGHDRFAVTVRSQIPVARGLGSSAALAAAAAAARRCRGSVRRRRRLRRASRERGRQRVRRASSPPPWWRPTACTRALPLSEELAFVVVVPERNLATPEARRRAARDAVSRADAVFNLGRMGLLVAGLAEPDRAEARGDGRPHPPAGPHRAVPRGAASCWAAWSRPARWRPAGRARGPSLIGMVRADAAATVRGRGRGRARRVRACPGRALVLRPDRRGLVYGDEAEVRLLEASARRASAFSVVTSPCSCGDGRVDVEGVEHLVVVGLRRLRVAEDLQAVGERLGRVEGRGQVGRAAR